MSHSLVASGHGGCGWAFSSCPGFWGPSISKTLPQSAGFFFFGVYGAGLSASSTPGEGLGEETQHDP